MTLGRNEPSWAAPKADLAPTRPLSCEKPLIAAGGASRRELVSSFPFRDRFYGW